MAKPKVVIESKDQFDHLQKKLVPLWKSMERFNQDPQTIVVVASICIDAISEGAVMQAYEERFLFLLLLLRQPRARLIYVTSSDSAKYHRLLPRSTARRHPEPCASAALFALAARRVSESPEPEAARSATLHRANTFFNLGSGSRPPCSFQHNRFGERAGTAARHSNVLRLYKV